MPVSRGGRGVMAGDDGRKRPHSVMATDSDWCLVRSRAGRADLSASEYLVSRGLAPEEPAAVSPEDFPLAVRRRALVDLRLLVLAERMRFEDEGRGGVWRRLVEEAEASVAADGREG